ncbi:uncharacterized protein LOC118185651 [Stegodyphus dumicola]|uniref:uncharacterized protein LOC118185651 n=1 Tax=Stegodyphus dumicola TaxID=202533 RepID=UPI0015A88554|nr:uncharacterized protein LOC118185651 [Stegodyphus dumicola]
MQAVGKFKDEEIKCIPQNSEKFISVSLGRLRFIDSLQFLNASLEKLAANLEPQQFQLTRTYFREKTDLMLRKGVYPYEYLDSFERFDEPHLPPLSAFYSHLTESDINDEDYQHANRVWEDFGLRHLGDYHDLYVKSDVLLLADIFQNFRRLCLDFYKLDPAHVYTAPGLAWQAALRMTDVQLELLTDPDMYLFIEKGIRGGIAMISHRFSQANNKYMENYDPTKPSSYIMYLDANNLYG